ncbi:MAG: ATP-binding protein [Deltaproteobacteria bacterium]|nr:MAG: ATP-binding protein [Deltaproteobacteria bacterium]
MAVHRRYLAAQVVRDLRRKMVFVSGPRQVGKTTLARSLPGAGVGYLNWDVAGDRERILRGELPVARRLIFDELHKYRGWRGFLKGVFDGRAKGQQILVTGSARLDFYRHGGESLQGRYHLLRLHPLSVAELGLKAERELHDLLTLGGFPEPFFTGSEVEARRWSREYRNLLVREEITSLERVQDLGRLELMMLRLPELVGSPLSVNNLREDLHVSHKTASGWLAILERLYAVSASAVQRRQDPCRQEGAEALSPRLDAGSRGRSSVREPRRRASAQVGPLRAGCPRARCRAPLLPRHGPARGGLRRRGEAGADPPRRMQVGRRRRRPEPPLSQGAVPGRAGVADQRGRPEGLSDARRDSGRARRSLPSDARMSVRAVGRVLDQRRPRANFSARSTATTFSSVSAVAARCRPRHGTVAPPVAGPPAAAGRPSTFSPRRITSLRPPADGPPRRRPP